jgi:hypothetical protein
MRKRGVSGQEAGTKSIYGTTKKRVCKITRKPLIQQFGDPKGTRTPVAGVRGRFLGFYLVLPHSTLSS